MARTRRQSTPRASGTAAVLAVALACTSSSSRNARIEEDVGGIGLPARPPACREVAAGSALQVLLDSAESGSALCLAPGEYTGPLRIGAGVTLWGPREAVIRSSGAGTTIRLEADGATVLGITVDGSGGRFDLLDAAVRIEGKGVRVEGVRIRNAVFGLLAEKSKQVILRGNEVKGDPEQTLGMRGDGIRLWETSDSRVEDNVLQDSRDVVVWYSSRNLLLRNRIERGRYGTHLMYSHENRLEGNRYVGNVAAIFVMYSRDVQIRDNLLADSGGAAGMGLGIKESGNLDVRGNRFVHNTVGIYLDTSPLYEDDSNVFEGNLFRLGDAGVVFHSSETRNTFLANDFRDLQACVLVEGGGDALGVTWRGNYFDDYAGYDLDGDGVGDLPYEYRSLANELTARVPALAFFRGTPALGLVETIGRIVPLFEPRLILVDPAPRIAAHEEDGTRAD
ncbi:MAG TPA: nitrous oxide reductase family maturation protein NosD [Deltaproteobacteria bacterium]|nr:nitrous oxide reductase family maturation protein NosD [Deltaproteobacteria bacterium]